MNAIHELLVEYIKDQLIDETFDNEERTHCYSLQGCDLDIVVDAVVALDYVSHKFLVDTVGDTTLVLPTTNNTLIVNTQEVDSFYICLDGEDVRLTHDTGLTIGCINPEHGGELASDEQIDAHVTDLIELLTVITADYESSILVEILKKAC